MKETHLHMHGSLHPEIYIKLNKHGNLCQLTKTEISLLKQTQSEQIMIRISIVKHFVFGFFVYVFIKERMLYKTTYLISHHSR